MFKKILIFAFCISLLTSCADSSSSTDGSAASNSSITSSSTAPEDESLWNDIKYWLISGASIPIPNGFASDEGSTNDTRYYSGPNGGKIHIMTEAFKVEMTEEVAQKKLDNIKDTDEHGAKWTYSNKKSELTTVNAAPAFVIYYHVKVEAGSDVQEWDEGVLYFNISDTTVRISLQGDLLKSGNFKKFCDMIELSGVKDAKDISFDDVNYVEVDDLMIPVPKSFKVENERDFSGENASIHYFSTAKKYDISEYGMKQEVEEIKKGYNDPDVNMYQDNEVHSSKLDFIGGKMAYYISYTAKIKSSANDTDPTVVERTVIYLNTSEQGVYITLSGDMTKGNNFKAFCNKIKYK